MFELRGYQKEAVDVALDFLRNSKKVTDRGVLIEPTGSGKSLIIASIVNELMKIEGINSSALDT